MRTAVSKPRRIYNTFTGAVEYQERPKRPKIKFKCRECYRECTTIYRQTYVSIMFPLCDSCHSISWSDVCPCHRVEAVDHAELPTHSIDILRVGSPYRYV